MTNVYDKRQTSTVLNETISSVKLRVNLSELKRTNKTAF